jgi:hypothetical protein
VKSLNNGLQAAYLRLVYPAKLLTLNKLIGMFVGQLSQSLAHANPPTQLTRLPVTGAVYRQQQLEHPLHDSTQSAVQSCVSQPECSRESQMALLSSMIL